jgi:acetyl-CoA carboxylase biotin carboxyl carrier protein
MANGGSSSGEVFDVRKVRRFVELMNEHDLTELDLRQGDQRIRLRRGQDEVLSVSPAPAVAAPAAPGGASTPAPDASSAADSGGEEDPNATYITSPMVGTFYVASGPDTPAFVSVGDQVGPDTTVCIIEAMKVFNEIPAECSGKITAVLVSNGDSVEFGQKLYQVTKPS